MGTVGRCVLAHYMTDYSNEAEWSNDGMVCLRLSDACTQSSDSKDSVCCEGRNDSFLNLTASWAYLGNFLKNTET